MFFCGINLAPSIIQVTKLPLVPSTTGTGSIRGRKICTALVPGGMVHTWFAPGRWETENKETHSLRAKGQAQSGTGAALLWQHTGSGRKGSAVSNPEHADACHGKICINCIANTSLEVDASMPLYSSHRDFSSAPCCVIPDCS